jgi:hypothetical protein
MTSLTIAAVAATPEAVMWKTWIQERCCAMENTTSLAGMLVEMDDRNTNLTTLYEMFRGQYKELDENCIRVPW